MASRPEFSAGLVPAANGGNSEEPPAIKITSSSHNPASTGATASTFTLPNPTVSTIKSRPKLPQRLSGIPHSLKLNLRKGSNRTGVPTEAEAELLGLLCVRVIAARNLASKDRNGKSDPFLVFRIGEARVESEVVKASLNPLWGNFDSGEKDLYRCDGCSEKEAFCVAPIWAETLHTTRIEIVAWDKDNFRRNEYMGEISFTVADWLDASNPSIPIPYGAVGCEASIDSIASQYLWCFSLIETVTADMEDYRFVERQVQGLW